LYFYIIGTKNLKIKFKETTLVGINLAKDVLDVYTENFKTMLTVIKGNLNKGELCLVHGKETQYC